jgi:hypothetical protein
MFRIRRSSRTVISPGGLRPNGDARPGTASQENLLMIGILWMAGALYHLGFAAFHAFFWKLFRWKTSLRTATPLNRAVVQVLNLCLIYPGLFIKSLPEIRIYLKILKAQLKSRLGIIQVIPVSLMNKSYE